MTEMELELQMTVEAEMALSSCIEYARIKPTAPCVSTMSASDPATSPKTTPAMP